LGASVFHPPSIRSEVVEGHSTNQFRLETVPFFDQMFGTLQIRRHDGRRVLDLTLTKTPMASGDWGSGLTYVASTFWTNRSFLLIDSHVNNLKS
jgi:hypothetical protein